MEGELNTEGLENILRAAGPDAVAQVLDDHADDLIADGRPFACYVRELLTRHKKTQIEVISGAGFSAKYGYRLLSEERHTRQRDYILRLAFAGDFTLEETQRLLKLYGMSPLYARIPRDAVLLACLTAEKTTVSAVDRLLSDNGFPELKKGEETGF